MQITRETDYAIRCVHYLTRTYGRVTMVDEIAKEMCIPKSFLAKIVQKLSKAGIVRSYRGVKGGFELSRHPGKITLLHVIEATQGPVAMNACAVDPQICGFSSACSIHPVWVEVRKKVENMLRKKNFADLGSL
ncbi:MAG: Rrf2 family transcriptional regulator [Nitrospiraceae bacterium]|nr:Rrf2 family transcriptional regulator [Nitrospiraceae bacterium]